jgi:hypothetical protein
MQKAIKNLLSLGKLPREENVEEDRLKQYERLLGLIQCPVTVDEAVALLAMFGDDDCYGLAWTLLHIIETAPIHQLIPALVSSKNEWAQRIVLGARNAGFNVPF